MLADWATTDSLAGALEYALKLYGQPKLFNRMRRNGMASDFSWKRSAETYAEIYRHLSDR